MADLYQPCPCGSGQKIKFCCHDILPEMDKVRRLHNSNQIVQAAEYLETLNKKHPNRIAIEGYLARMYLMQGKVDEALALAQRFAEREPNNPVAVVDYGMVLTFVEGPSAGALKLQEGLERAGEQPPSAVRELASVLVQSFVRHGNVLAYYGHLMMTLNDAQLTQEDYGRLAASMQSIFRSSDLPLIQRTTEPFDYDYQFPPAPAEYAAAKELMRHGMYRRSAEELEKLAAAQPQQARLRQCIALLWAWAGQKERAAEEFRKFAAASPSLHQKTVAAALANSLAPPEPISPIEEMVVTFAVQDVDRLNERLLSSPRVRVAEIDLARIPLEEGQVRPRQVYSLLNQPQVRDAAELTRDNAPQSQAVLMLYGRQTDREPMLSVQINRDENYDAALATLGEVGGDALGEKLEEVAIGLQSRADALFQMQFQPPRGTTGEQLEKIYREELDHRLLHVYPDIPLGELNGRTLRDAARDPAERANVEAVLLDLLLERNNELPEGGVDRLRQALSLPPLDNFGDYSDDNFRWNTTLDLWLDYSQAGAPLLSKVANDALRTADTLLIVAAASAVAGREEISPELRGTVLLTAAYNEPLSDQAIAQVNQAREILKKANVPDSEADFVELEVRLSRREPEAAQLLERVVRRYAKDPQHQSRIASLLMRLGLIDEYGQPIQQGMGGGALPAEPEPSSGLWVPGQAQAPAAPSPTPGKSGLWLPD